MSRGKKKKNWGKERERKEEDERGITCPHALVE